MNRLLIRADGSPSVGTGHLMRCLALAQAWQDAGGDVQFATTGELPQVVARLAAEGVNHARIAAASGGVADAAETAVLGQESGAAWIVVDGYCFGGAYQDALRQARQRVLFLDDYVHADHYSADLILNQNLYASESLYAGRHLASRLLLGSRYILLRREFRCRQDRRRQPSAEGRRILVTLGGSDPDNFTSRVMEALQLLKRRDLEAQIVVGPANRHHHTVARAARDLPFTARVERNPNNLPDLMAWADLAISAAGSTTWELAFMGVPQLVLATAPNQEPIAVALECCGLAVSLAPARAVSTRALADKLEALLHNTALRSQLAESGWQTVDGQGAARVAALLAEGSAM